MEIKVRKMDWILGFGIFMLQVDWILQAIKEHSILSVVLGVLAEQIIAPIPSSLVGLAAGFILIESSLPITIALLKIFYIIAIPASLAATLGSFFVYWIAYLFGKSAIKKFGKFLDVSWREVRKLTKKFEKGYKDDLLILGLRSLPAMPLSPVSFVCGALRYDWKRFVILTLLGCIPRYFILGFLGWKFGEGYEVIASKLNWVENILLVIILFVIGLTFYILVKRKFE